eukprot:3144378-Ditylum_brightwellii.AAC.1
MEDFLDDKPINFTPRQSKKGKGKTEYWADSSFYDIVHMPASLENICAYELMMKYERRKLNQSNIESGVNKHLFDNEHPWRYTIFLRESNHFKVPIITANKGSHDIEDLEIESNHVSEHTESIKESHAKRALI